MSAYKDFEYIEMSNGNVLTDFPNIGQLLFKSKAEFVAYVDGYHFTDRFLAFSTNSSAEAKKLYNRIKKLLKQQEGK
jgi:hypothetical protein